MAGNQSYIVQVGIDWSEGKASTQDFISSVQTQIAELEARAASGASVAQGGITPRGLGAEAATFIADLERIQGAFKSLNIPIPKELKDLLGPGAPGLLQQLQGVKFPGTSLEKSGAQFTAAYANQRSALAAGAGGEGESLSPAEKQQAKAAELRSLAADEEYVQATVDVAAARLELLAAVNAAKAGDEEYLQANTEAAINKVRLASVELDELRASEEYIGALVEAATIKNQLAAVESEGLAASAQYLASVVLAATAKEELATLEREGLAGSAEYLAALVGAATTKNELSALERQALSASSEYAGSVAEAAATKNQLSSAEREALAASQEYLGSTLEAATTKLLLAASEREMLVGNQGYLDSVLRDATTKLELEAVERETLAASVEYRAAVLRAAAAKKAISEREIAGGGGGGGDDEGGGGGRKGFLGGLFGGGKDFGQETGGRLRSSAAFFASGILIFGVVDQIRNAIKASGELEKEFGVIKAQLADFGQSDSFGGIRQQIFDLSVETATSAAEVAKVERQLAGVFANQQTGQPNFDRAGTETETALKFAKVSGESFTEIVDDFSAIAVSFGNDKDVILGGFESIANGALSLSQQLGVPEAEILKFTSDLAPLGASLGFTAKQLESLGAVVLQASGRGASGLAEQIGRSLAGLQDKFPQLVELFGQNDKTRGIIGDLGSAFGSGDIPKVLELLVANYKDLNQAQLENLALIVGGRREAGTFYALLQRAPETLKALREGFNTEGNPLDERFKAVSESITFQFDQAKLAVQRFLIVLLDSGVADGLGAIAGAVSILAEGIAGIVDLFSAFGEFPSKIVAIAIEVLALVKAFEALRAVVLATNIGKALLPGTAAKAEGGSLGGIGATGIAAVAVGVIALDKLNDAVAQRKGIRASGNQITSNAVDALARGESIDDIRARANKAGDLGTLGNLGSDVYTNLFGQKDVDSLITDAQQQFQNNRKTAELQTIVDKTAPTDSAKDHQAKLDFIDRLKNNPTSDALNSLADQVIANQNDPGIKQALADVNAQADKDDADLRTKQDEVDSKAGETQSAIDRLQDPRSAKALSDLQKDFAKGDAGPAAIKAALQGRIDDLNLALDAVVAGGKSPDDPDVQKLRDERDKLQGQLEQDVKSAILGQAQFDEKLREALGQNLGDSGLQAVLDSVNSTASQLSDNGLLDGSTEQELILQGINALTARRKEKASAAATALERDAILSQPIPIPPELQRLIVDTQYRSGAGADFVKEFSDITGQSIEEARNHIVDLTIQLGGDMEAVAAQLKVDAFNLEKEAIKAAQKLDKKFNGSFASLGGIFKAHNLKDEIEKATGLNDADIDAFANTIGATSDVAVAVIARDFDRYGGDVFKLRRSILLQEKRVAVVAIQKIAKLYQALKSTIFGDEAEKALQQALDALHAIDAAITANSEAAREARGNATVPSTVAPGEIGPDQSNAAQAASDARNEAQALANAQLDVAAAQAKGDAVRLARIAQQRAQVDYQFAQTESERVKAQAAMIEADNQLATALEGYNNTFRALVLAQNNNDPILAAVLAQQSAAEEAANALPDSEAALKAATDAIKAAHEKAKAEQDRQDNITNLAIAQAELNGDPVKAAKLKLQELQSRLANAAALGLNTDEILTLQSQITQQTLSVAETQISQGERQIQTSLDLGRISKGQAISQLEALKSFAKNQQEIDQIDLEIKHLRDSLGQDFKFNLPSVLGLPTLYEARRANQSFGGGSGGYNDNRVTTVNIYAQTGATAADIAAQVANVVGDPTRNAVATRRY